MTQFSSSFLDKTLNVTVLKGLNGAVDLNDHEMVNAVISMCPQLQEMSLYAGYVYEDFDYNLDYNFDWLRRLFSNRLTKV